MPTFEAGHMPPCDSSFVRHLLKQTLEEAPDSNGFKVIKLAEFLEATPKPGADAVNPTTDPNQSPEFRNCSAHLFTNELTAPRAR